MLLWLGAFRWADAPWCAFKKHCVKCYIQTHNEKVKHVFAVLWWMYNCYIEVWEHDLSHSLSLCCSYMTDGGLGLYTRRLNRLPDSMAAVRETLHRNTMASSGPGDADRWAELSVWSTQKLLEHLYRSTWTFLDPTHLKWGHTSITTVEFWCYGTV